MSKRRRRSTSTRVQRARAGQAPPLQSTGGAGATSAPAAGGLRNASGSIPPDARALADAVFARLDPVEVGCHLLEGDDAKGASVKARVWEKLVEYRYGKSTSVTEETPPGGALRVVWDIPAPAREVEAAEET